MENLLKIQNECIEWAQDNLGKGFSFRENQLETISNIIYEKVYQETPHHIIQAPTGAGKSLINIICAGVLWTYYNKKSYILTSDLFLYQQYVDFIEEYNLEEFKYIKGQTGNYFCAKQKSDMRNCACKLAKITYKDLAAIYFDNKNLINGNKKLEKIKKNFPCIPSCQYLAERFEATKAPITLMTYHNFYFQMNICNCKYDSHGKLIEGQFDYRDLIFCDECHNIPSIMQNTCQPTIKRDDIYRLKKIYNFYKSLKKNPENIKLLKNIKLEDIENIFQNIWSEILNKDLDSFKNTCLILKYNSKIVSKINKIGNRIQNIFANKLISGLELNEKEKEINSEISWLQNYSCYIGDFCRAIELTGYHYTFKQILPGHMAKFGCVKEDGIIYSFLLKYARFGTTLCSATIGNINSFIENCGFKHFDNNITLISNTICDEFPEGISWKLSSKVNYYNLPSNFDFSNSPIYLDFEHKLNYNNKKENIIPISKKINKIINYHKNENGLIQTGSYEIANLIYNQIDNKNKKRILIYKNSSEKKELIKKINKTTNYILVGPSINEGIDLPGALCEFIIIAKVPFLSLGDKYVTSKMKIFKKWYNDTTMNNIIQGIGRGNRFKNDKSKIYILDGCFKRLFSYTKKFWPNFITDRFINININDLFKNHDKSSNNKYKEVA